MNLETLSPTKDEFFLLIKQSNYTALIRKLAFQLHPVTLFPRDHHWLLKDKKLEVQWMDQPFIQSSLSEIFLGVGVGRQFDPSFIFQEEFIQLQ